MQYNLHNEHSGIYSENITPQKKKTTNHWEAEWDQGYYEQSFGRSADSTTCNWREADGGWYSRGPKVIWQQLPTKPKPRTGIQLKIISFWDLVTLLSTTGRHFSLPGIIVLKASYTSSCNCSHSHLLRHGRGYWWCCYFHFWLKRSMGRAHILAVGDFGSKFFCPVWSTSLCASALHLTGSPLCSPYSENPCWIDPAVRRGKVNLVPGSQASLDVQAKIKLK